MSLYIMSINDLFTRGRRHTKTMPTSLTTELLTLTVATVKQTQDKVTQPEQERQVSLIHRKSGSVT